MTMTDGAHLGLRPTDAMRCGFIGMTAEEVAKKARSLDTAAADIEASVHPDDFVETSGEYGNDSYNNCADYAAKLVLTFFKEHPEATSVPIENVYDRGSPKVAGRSPLIVKGLFDMMGDAGVSLDDLGLTGFMWGWAVNMARTLCELPPVPNPSIFSFGGG